MSTLVFVLVFILGTVLLIFVASFLYRGRKALPWSSTKPVSKWILFSILGIAGLVGLISMLPPSQVVLIISLITIVVILILANRFGKAANSMRLRRLAARKNLLEYCTQKGWSIDSTASPKDRRPRWLPLLTHTTSKEINKEAIIAHKNIEGREYSIEFFR